MKRTEEPMMLTVQNKSALTDAIICSSGFALFAFLITNPFPLKAVAFIPLALAAFIISRNINGRMNYTFFLPRDILSKKMLIHNAIGLLAGIAGAIWYRVSYGMPVFPAAIQPFVLVAVSIGITEELIFRGFIQGRLNKLHPGFAIAFAAMAHACYKACLFLSPAAQQQLHIMEFFTYSFGAFLLLGLLKFYSKNIAPAVIAHAMFDLVVYAETLQAPWWVW